MPKPAMTPSMATVESWTPSRRIRAAAAAESERIARELARLGARERELLAEVAAVQVARDELVSQQRTLDQFADGTATARPRGTGRRLRAVPQPTGEKRGAGVLRGAKIRETAVQVLVAAQGVEQPVHYRDWYALLVAKGYEAGGKEPMATFLTQIGRSPVVTRTTTAGVYVLDATFPARARRRLEALRAELAATQALAPDASVEQIAAARERRTRLTAEMHDAERQLDEALRSLGSTVADDGSSQ